jgi:hypothetical protein
MTYDPGRREFANIDRGRRVFKRRFAATSFIRR